MKETNNYLVAKHANEHRGKGLASLAINETKSKSLLKNDLSPLEEHSKDGQHGMKGVFPAWG